MQQLYIGTKLIKAQSMTRQEYNDYRGWQLPEDEQHLAKEAGYLVEYTEGGRANDDRHEGYISWSPANVFEAHYKLSGSLSFGNAIEFAKRGHKIARAGWSGKGTWVIYNPASQGQTYAMSEGSVYKEHGVDKCEILPHFDICTINAEGRQVVLPGWLASQSDMIAEDWCII